MGSGYLGLGKYVGLGNKFSGGPYDGDRVRDSNDFVEAILVKAYAVG